MAKSILVPLRTNEDMNTIVKRIEKIAHPGSRIVFLMRYPIDGYRWGSECELSVPSKLKKVAAHYGWAANLQRARRKVLPALEAITRMGLEPSVQVYAGSLKKALQSYSPQDQGCVVINRLGLPEWFAARVNRFISRSKSVKSLSSAAALNSPRGRI